MSIVAFGFRHTRVRGLAIPGHVSFPEINLRFYVRLHGERAVAFIREFVPRSAISLVARLFYNEPYRTIPMRETVIAPGRGPRARLGVRHRFGARHRNSIEAWACPVARAPDPGSSAYWLTHHAVGLGTARDGRARSYRVEHPVWALHAVSELRIDVDFATLYGAGWVTSRRRSPRTSRSPRARQSGSPRRWTHADRRLTHHPAQRSRGSTRPIILRSGPAARRAPSPSAPVASDAAAPRWGAAGATGDRSRSGPPTLAGRPVNRSRP